MKKLTVFCAGFFALSVSAELLAQTRGPRYNPGGGSSSSSSSSSPRSSSSSSSSTTHGPRYNPIPPLYTQPRHQQVPGAVWVGRTVRHVPRTVIHNGPIRYISPRDYYSHVSRRYIYRRWIQKPVVFSYSDGYWEMDGYPYYVHRGMRYRYDPVDLCQYELVNGEDYTTVKTFSQQSCSAAYDECALKRDSLNSEVRLEQYFCAEAVDKDQEQTETEVYEPTPMEMTEAKKAEIRDYLSDMEFSDIFNDGRSSFGNCSIVKNGGLFSRGNEFDCKYTVKYKDQSFPLVDGSICSYSESAATIGCDVGTEKKNAGCIMQKAIEAGYCL